MARGRGIPGNEKVPAANLSTWGIERYSIWQLKHSLLLRLLVTSWAGWGE